MRVYPVSNGKLDKVAHFDSKAQVEEYIRGLEIPSTFFLPGFYMSNIPGQSLNNRQNGKYNIALPIPTDSPMPLFDAGRDTGKFVKGILLNRSKLLGARVLGATDYYTPAGILEEFQSVKSRDGGGGMAIQAPEDMFKKILASKGLSEDLQEEMLQNMQLMPQFGYYGGANLNESHSVRYIYIRTRNTYVSEVFPLTLRQILTDRLTTWKEFVEQESSWADLQ